VQGRWRHRAADQGIGHHRAVPAVRPSVSDRFNGFTKDAPRFFHELAAEMSRDWFAEHKAEYEALWLRPMEALLGQVAAGLRGSYRGLAMGEPKIFRIHRDVRFSADKTPYKTHIAGVIPVGAGKKPTQGAVALYMHLGLEEFAGAGHYIFDGAQLVRWRKLVAAERTGKVIAGLCADAKKAKLSLGAHEVLARAPRGVDAAHPRLELLRHKGLITEFPAIPRGLIHKAGLVEWLVEQGKKAAPVVGWLAKNVG
jgi:uncharacterized protein (TIGR02453 family)